MEATTAISEVATLQSALDRAHTALIECHELFKTIARADIDGGGEVCFLTLANIGARIADDASDATIPRLARA